MHTAALEFLTHGLTGPLKTLTYDYVQARLISYRAKHDADLLIDTNMASLGDVSGG